VYLSDYPADALAAAKLFKSAEALTAEGGGVHVMVCIDKVSAAAEANRADQATTTASSSSSSSSTTTTTDTTSRCSVAGR
jgi:hypothetical protein